jgi:hypothetical protein
LGDQASQLVDGHYEDFTGIDPHCGHQNRLTGEQAELSEEAAGTVNAEHPVARPKSLDDCYPAFEDHKEVAGSIPRPVQDLPRLGTAPGAQGRE